MNYYLLLLSTLVFSSYVMYVFLKWGVLESISASYYKLPSPWIFTIVFYTFAFPMILVGSSVLMFLAGAGIVFVGAAPALREQLVQKVHIIGAVGGITFGTIALWVDLGYWWLFAIAVAHYAYLYLRKRDVAWWVEIMAFVYILLGLLLHNLNS